MGYGVLLSLVVCIVMITGGVVLGLGLFEYAYPNEQFLLVGAIDLTH